MCELLMKTKSLLTLAVFSFLGGFAGQLAIAASPAMASKALSYLSLADDSNAKGIEMYVHNGSPAQNFYTSDGKLRLQMGTYTAEGERGMPLASFNDNGGNVKMLLRLAGENESPVLIMKDKQHRDRIVMGLGLSGNEEPFLVIYDQNGNKKTLFGSF
jgi:hypothetical protein